MVTSRDEDTLSQSVESRFEDYIRPNIEPSGTFAVKPVQEKSLRELLIESSGESRSESSSVQSLTEMDSKSSGHNRKKRGRKPAKVDVEARLQRSRQSARECRARKKMRYRLLEELIDKKETENLDLRKELEECLNWYNVAQKGEKVPQEVIQQYKEDLTQKGTGESLEEFRDRGQ